MCGHDRGRQAREVLDVAHAALEDREPKQDEQCAAGAGGGVPVTQEHHRGDGKGAEEQPDRQRVESRDDERVEGESIADLGVARVGACARDDDAEHEHRDREQCHDAGHGERGAWDQGSGGAVALVPAVEQIGRDRDENHRDEQVPADDCRVQLHQHGDATDDRLREREDDRHEAECAQLLTA